MNKEEVIEAIKKISIRFTLTVPSYVFMMPKIGKTS